MAAITSIAEFPTSLKTGRIRRAGTIAVAIKQAASGRFTRTKLWEYFQEAFEIDYGVVDDEYFMEQLYGFWHGVGGPYREFLFQYWPMPHPRGEVIGIGDGTTTLFKIYGDYFDSVVVRVNGITTAPSAISPSTGFIYMTTPPAAGDIVTADVTNEKFNCLCLPDAFQVEHLGGTAYAVAVRIVQQKTLA